MSTVRSYFKEILEKGSQALWGGSLHGAKEADITIPGASAGCSEGKTPKPVAGGINITWVEEK